jgi:hypothetical protein
MLCGNIGLKNDSRRITVRCRHTRWWQFFPIPSLQHAQEIQQCAVLKSPYTLHHMTVFVSERPELVFLTLYKRKTSFWAPTEYIPVNPNSHSALTSISHHTYAPVSNSRWSESSNSGLVKLPLIDILYKHSYLHVTFPCPIHKSIKKQNMLIKSGGLSFMNLIERIIENR